MMLQVPFRLKEDVSCYNVSYATEKATSFLLGMAFKIGTKVQQS